MNEETQLMEVTDLSCLRETIETRGLAIVPAVLSSSECDALKDGVWRGLEHITSAWEKPLLRDVQSSWSSFYDLYAKHAMLLQHWEIGHLQAVWDVRQNPRVCAPFEALWETNADDLLCSFDGLSVHLPPEQTGRGWFRQSKLHCDQSYQNQGLETVQAWVTANDVREGDATLAYLEGSHRFQPEVAQKFKMGRAHWNAMSPDMIRFYAETCGCALRHVECPAGSMVLWDSRTVHSGREPVRGRAEPNERYVVYVCMTPRARASAKNVQKRLAAFADKRMTGHCPHAPLLFPRLPRTYGMALPIMTSVPAPLLTARGHRLVGFPHAKDVPTPGGAAD